MSNRRSSRASRPRKSTAPPPPMDPTAGKTVSAMMPALAREPSLAKDAGESAELQELEAGWDELLA